MEIENLPEDLQRIMRMWNDNMSGRQIANELGISRNSVMGKIFRLKRNGYDVRQGYETSKGTVVVKSAEKKKPKVKQQFNQRNYIRLPVFNPVPIYVAPEPEPTKPLNLNIFDLKLYSCRYIMGNVAGVDTVYCGLPVKRGSYCKAHAKLCYNPPYKGPANDKFTSA